MLLEAEDHESLTMSEIDQRLTEARKALELVQKNTAAARDTHLEELAQHQFKHSSGDLAAVFKNIKLCKELKQAFQSMKPITKGITGGVVNKLPVPNSQKNNILSTIIMGP
eukprot:9717578-Ditylum_brightwellii.AAC.1